MYFVQQKRMQVHVFDQKIFCLVSNKLFFTNKNKCYILTYGLKLVVFCFDFSFFFSTTPGVHQFPLRMGKDFTIKIVAFLIFINFCDDCLLLRV